MESEEIWLNFHGIGPAPRQYDPGEAEYWISVSVFTEAIDLIAKSTRRKKLNISFDDGNKSDVDLAMPALHQRGLTAIFFILAGRIGEEHFVSRQDIQNLAAHQMTIGSHGFDHLDLRQLDKDQLHRELNESKSILEDILCQEVTDFSIPFGLYNKRILDSVQEAGYRRIFTSDRGIERCDAQIVRRNTIRSDDVPSTFAKWVTGHHGRIPRLVDDVRCLVKRLR